MTLQALLYDLASFAYCEESNYVYFFDIKLLIIFLIGPKEFFAIKATIEAMTTLEGKSTLLATASVLSRISLALPNALFMARISMIKAIPIIRKIMDQITTKIIKAISRTDIIIKYTASGG